MFRNKFLKAILILTIFLSWFFSGWPQIWFFDKIGTGKIQVLQEIDKIQAAAPAGQWWDTSFKYSQKITVTAGSIAVPTGYTVTSTIDHAALVTAGKSLSNGNDMRVTYWNGSSWTELDRVLDKGSNWNTSTTTILFKTQTVIATSTSDDNYYLYYGNSGAGTPPTNAQNVYDFYEDFSGDLSQWTIDSENTDKIYIATTTGNPSPSLRHDPDSSQTKNSYFDTRLITTNYKMQNGVIEYDVYLAGSTASSPRIIHQLGFRVNSLSFTNGYCWRLQNSAADGGHLRFTGRASWAVFGTAYPATTDNVWHSVKEMVNGSSYTGYVDGGSGYSGTDSTKLTADYLVSHVHGVSLTTSSYVLVDNIRVRKYVSPEPTTSRSAEEQFSITQSAYRWFNNLDSTNVGTALALQDTTTTLSSSGAVFRLRALLHITGGLPTNGQQFKLQFVGKGTGTCASPSGGTPSTWTDVNATTSIAYNDNPTPTDSSALTDNLGELTHGSDTIVPQTYEELNNFTNSVAAIPSGQDSKWDFSLIDNSAPASTTYCFLIVKSNGSVLDGYSVYPEITTAEAPVYSVTVSDGIITYGILDVGSSTSTLASGLNDTQTATNNGEVIENLNIKGSTSTCWTLATTIGYNQYVHEFSTSSGSSWTSLTTNYQPLATNVAVSATSTFDLRITVPDDTNCFDVQDVNVTVQAVAP